MLFGAMAFWAPDILVKSARREVLDNIVVLTILLPGSLLIFYRILCRFRSKQVEGPSIALSMLLGVWVLGPICIMTGASFSGGGFSQPIDKEFIVGLIFYTIFFIYTFIMSTYDGSLFGLLLATILMHLMHFRYEKNHWVIPPRILRHVKKYLTPSPFS